MIKDDFLTLTAQKFINTYFTSRNFDQVKNMFAPEGSWLGASNNTMANNLKQFDQYFKEGCNEGYVPEITFQDCYVIYNDDNIGIVYCNYHLHIESKGALFDMDQRVTIVLKQFNTTLKIIHVHASTPNDAISQEEFYTNEIAKLGYKELQQALKKKNEQIEMIIRTTAGGMKGSLDDEFYTYFYVNEELCKMLGYTYDEFMEMSHGTAVGAVYPPDLPAALADCKRCFAIGPEYKTEYRIRKKDGSLLWVMDSGRKVTDENGQVVINSIITDISELKEMVNRLKIDQERYEIVSQLSDDIIFEYDVENNSLVYQQLQADTPVKNILTNFLTVDLKNTHLYHGDIERFKKDLKIILSNQVSNELYKLEYRFAIAPQSYTWYRLTFRRIFDNDNKLTKVVGKVVDISSELRLKHQSITDPLTGTYNRLYITSAIQEYCHILKNNLSYACILIDIDYFKKINDTYGHIIGDRFLIEIVKIIKRFFRASDLIGRIGGDEFLIFIKDIYDKEIVREKADALIKKIHGYVTANNYPKEISISMGIHIDNRPEISFTELYNKVDIALYNAKHNGRDRYVYYHEGMTYPK